MSSKNPTKSTAAPRGEIVSLNIAAPQNIVFKGKTHSTGIFKRSTDGAQPLGAQGFAGDTIVEARKTGVEDQAVYAYPEEHYAYWQKRLGRNTFAAGHFGENLTLRGVLETAIRIGDIVRCGDALLQVTYSRTPCFKLNERMGLKFGRIFLQSRRTGFYLRVLKEGKVTPGDTFEVVDSAPDSPTVDEFVRISLFDYWDAEGLMRLLGARDLNAGLRESLEGKLERAQSAEGWFGLRELVVRRRVQECDDVVSLYLQCPHDKPLAPFSAGQYLTLTIRPKDSSPPIQRSYAISSSPYETDSYRITVRARPEAPSDDPATSVSRILTASFQQGATLRMAAPRGLMTLDEVDDDCEGLIFLSENIGIAPMVSMLHHWHARLRHIPAYFIHSTANKRSYALRHDVRAIAEQSTNLRVLLAYSAPLPDEHVGEDFHIQGAPDIGQLAAFLRERQAEIYIAGSSAFVEAMHGDLLRTGVDGGRIFHQGFGR